MARYERVAQIYGLLTASSEPMSLDSLCDALDASTATVKRLVRFMREDLNVPVDFDRTYGGYRIDRNAPLPLPAGPSAPAETPRPTFATTACELLEGVAPDLLADETRLLRERLGAPSADDAARTPDTGSRLRVLLPQRRPVDATRFRTVVEALNGGRRLRIRYRSRTQDGETERVVSPQRLTFHRSNWFLAAWCHVGREVRVFSVDRIEFAEALAEAGEIVDPRLLESKLDSGYGISAGEARSIAVLRFTPAAARWVGEEQWHPLQRRDRLGDGSVTLYVPYGNAAELRCEILRWGAEVEVVSPPELRSDLGTTLARAAALYA